MPFYPAIRYNYGDLEDHSIADDYDTGAIRW
jgi:hypothetical protein